MDPLSTAAAIIGVIAPALHGIRLLLNDLRRIEKAPQDILDLKNDVHSADQVLELLQAVESSEWESLGNHVAAEANAAIDDCQKACKIFREKIQRWTSCSKDGKLSWKDQAKMGFFRYEQIKSMSKQLQTCKLTITSTINIATLYSSIRQNHITEEIKETISERQSEITHALTATNQQLIEVRRRLQDLTIGDGGQALSETMEITEATESREDLLGRIRSEQEAMDVSQRLLNELLAKVYEAATKGAEKGEDRSQHVTISGAGNVGLQLGINNGTVKGFKFGR